MDHIEKNRYKKPEPEDYGLTEDEINIYKCKIDDFEKKIRQKADKNVGLIFSILFIITQGISIFILFCIKVLFKEEINEFDNQILNQYFLDYGSSVSIGLALWLNIFLFNKNDAILYYFSKGKVPKNPKIELYLKDFFKWENDEYSILQYKKYLKSHNYSLKLKTGELLEIKETKEKLQNSTVIIEGMSIPDGKYEIENSSSTILLVKNNIIINEFNKKSYHTDKGEIQIEEEVIRTAYKKKYYTKLGLGNSVFQNNTNAPDGKYQFNNRVILVNNSKVLNIFGLKHYKTDNGNIKIETQSLFFRESLGDMVYQDNKKVKNRKYRLGFMDYIWVEDGRIVKTITLNRHLIRFGKFEYNF